MKRTKIQPWHLLAALIPITICAPLEAQPLFGKSSVGIQYHTNLLKVDQGFETFRLFYSAALADSSEDFVTVGLDYSLPVAGPSILFDIGNEIQSSERFSLRPYAGIGGINLAGNGLLREHMLNLHLGLSGEYSISEGFHAGLVCEQRVLPPYSFLFDMPDISLYARFNL